MVFIYDCWYVAYHEQQLLGLPAACVFRQGILSWLAFRLAPRRTFWMPGRLTNCLDTVHIGIIKVIYCENPRIKEGVSHMNTTPRVIIYEF